MLTDEQIAAIHKPYLKRGRAGHHAFAKAIERAVTVELLALLPGTYYMDPPDGGDVSIMEQMRRMAEDAARYRWLTNCKQVPWGAFLVNAHEAGIDAAIDAARSATATPETSHRSHTDLHQHAKTHA
jgi:hypothetical protein